MTATPGATKRLATPGNSEDGQPLGPKVSHKADALTTGSRSAQSDISADPTAPTLITKSGDFNPSDALQDARGGQVQVITLSSFGGTDSFTFTLRDDSNVLYTTIAFVRGTNATAADIQAELRSILPGTDLTVVTGDTDAGPFTITFEPTAWSRRFPKVIAVQGTNCTGVVTRSKRSVVGGSALGSSKYDGDGVGPGHALTGPVTTTTPSATTAEVQYLTMSDGTTAGKVALQFRRGLAIFNWDATTAAIQTAIDNCFDQNAPYLSAADAPVVSQVAPEVLTIDLGDISTADTYKLTYNSVESTTLNTYAASDLVDVKALLAEVGLVHGTNCTVALVDANTYTVTNLRAGAFASTVTVTTVTGFTPLGTGGYTDGGKVTTAASATPIIAFTFSGTGALAGVPVRGGFRVFTSLTTTEDDGVQEDPAISVNTAGVLGSASVAYTELATYGDSVLVTLTHNTTGRSYGNGTAGEALLDTDSPVVIGSLPKGIYTVAARTYNAASQRLGPVAAALEQVTVS